LKTLTLHGREGIFKDGFLNKVLHRLHEVIPCFSTDLSTTRCINCGISL
jgi:hypothetical protein